MLRRSTNLTLHQELWMVTKSRNTKWMRHATLLADVRNAYPILAAKLKERDHLTNLGVDRKNVPPHGLPITESTGSGTPEVPSYQIPGGIPGPPCLREAINTETWSSRLGSCARVWRLPAKHRISRNLKYKTSRSDIGILCHIKRQDEVHKVLIFGLHSSRCPDWLQFWHAKYRKKRVGIQSTLLTHTFVIRLFVYPWRGLPFFFD
jgi:hypothetical protein